MADTSPRVVVRGIPNRPDINVRSGPGTTFALVFKVAVGSTAQVLDAQPDAAHNNFQGKVYQWLKLRLDNGLEVWARDDLLDLLPGDFTALGYGLVSRQHYAFTLTREVTPTPPPNSAPIGAPAGGETTSTPASAPASPPPEPPETPQPAEPAPEPKPASAPPADEEAGSTAIVIGARGTINARGGPSTRYPIVLHLLRGTRLDVLGVAPQVGGGPLRWVKITHAGKEAWVREDLLSFRGAESVARGLVQAGLYPAPMGDGEYWWVRGFSGPQPNHPGWDLGAIQGEPVLGGPRGGTVIVSFQAVKATPDKPRTLDHGLSLGDARVFSDAGWGFGYGHYVIVRYPHEALPEVTQQALAARGLPGAHLAVMYAHLHQREVEAGVQLQPGQAIGQCGTTGNSEAPHVHLEVRATQDASETRWARMARGLIEPDVLFNR
jgi:uncharacterized protein YraI